MNNNIFAVYKPEGVTSHDIVNQVRRNTGVKRVGHGGTLDPLAEGVLVIAVGRENTKQLDKYVKEDKEYVATLTLGYESETDDREGPIHEYNSTESNLEESSKKQTLTLNDVKGCIKKFIGKIKQTPPSYSAIKVNGKEAYKRIRKGEVFEMEPRTVEIKKIEILRYKYPELEIRVTCGSGTYIRSLARDIGRKLEVGAYLSKLIRTRVGEFTLEDTLSLQQIDSSNQKW